MFFWALYIYLELIQFWLAETTSYNIFAFIGCKTGTVRREKAKQVKHIPPKQAKKERKVNAKPQATTSAAEPSSKAKPTKRIPPKQAKKELQFNAKRYSVPVKPKTINEKRLPKKASTYKSRQAVVQPQPFIFSNQVRTERQATTDD